MSTATLTPPVTPFAFFDNLLRVITRTGSPWFVIGDICKSLDIANPWDIPKRLHRDDLDSVEVIDSLGRKQKTNICNESGLYQVIFQSRKPIATEFTRWVTSEVIPAIRKTGSYFVPTAQEASQKLPSARVLELVQAGVSPEGAEKLVLADMEFLRLRSGDPVDEIAEARMLARMSNPMERAEALGKLRDRGMKASELMTELGCKKDFVYLHLVLLTLSPSAQEAIRSRKVSAGTGGILARVPHDRQVKLVKTICTKNLTERESKALIRGSAKKKR